MRSNYIFSLIILLFLITCCSPEKRTQDGLAYIDVTKNYPEKEIPVTDIADVTYVQLNTVDDDYLYRGVIDYTTENTIVVMDGSSRSILFFSRDGNPKSRINRRGQGPEEYPGTYWVLYDEAADEVFVVPSPSLNFIQVYSSTGIHKRKIEFPLKGRWLVYFMDFDDHSLFFGDYTIINNKRSAQSRGEGWPTEDKPVIPFYRISKTTGEILDYFELPDARQFMGINLDGRWVTPGSLHSTQCSEGVMSWSAGTDTVYLYRSDKSLTPVIRLTPSLSSMNPMRYLALFLDRGQYQFFQIFTLPNGILRPSPDVNHFQPKCYLRNKKTGEVIHPKFIIPDYNGKEFRISLLASDYGIVQKDEYALEMSLYELRDAYRENKLSGKLKELVATLNEDEDNTVWMLVKFK